MNIASRKFKRRRQQLVEKLQEKGISDERVLEAIGSVDRHKMIDTALEEKAYEDTALPIGYSDRPLPIGEGQTISQPYTVARQTELLQLSEGEKVLEVGTGSGYQAAVLCEMGAKVYSVERVRELYDRTRDLLREMGYRITMKCGDGTKGWSAYAPYDAIVVTAGAPVIPEDLAHQLTIGGVLVIPVGDNKVQKMIRLTRTGDNDFDKEEFSNFKFVPLIGEHGWEGE